MKAWADVRPVLRRQLLAFLRYAGELAKFERGAYLCKLTGEEIDSREWAEALEAARKRLLEQ